MTVDFVGNENLCPANSTLYERSTTSVKLYVPLCAPTHHADTIIIEGKSFRMKDQIES